MDHPSLESLVESGVLEVESLHPGGLELTREFATSCGITNGMRVLDVACGTGETALFLAEQFQAEVWGLDASDELLTRAIGKAGIKGLDVHFRQGDAIEMPFPDDSFDVAICECTLCLLDKTAVLQEMTRVVHAGGCVGMHDLFWVQGAPDKMKTALAETEGEEPETLAGWQRLFAIAGLVDIRAVDQTELKSRWMRDSRKELGLLKQLRVFRYVIGRWGIAGMRHVLRSERIVSSRHLGYGIVCGTKP